MRFVFTSLPVDKVRSELLVLLHYRGQVPLRGLLGQVDWRLNGRLSGLIKQDVFVGTAKDRLLMPAERRIQSEGVLIVGLGDRESFEESHVSAVFDYVLESIKDLKVKRICLSLSKLSPSQFEWRNAVRLFVAKLVDNTDLEEVIFREPPELVQEAKRRQMDFGAKIHVGFD